MDMQNLVLENWPEWRSVNVHHVRNLSVWVELPYKKDVNAMSAEKKLVRKRIFHLKYIMPGFKHWPAIINYHGKATN